MKNSKMKTSIELNNGAADGAIFGYDTARHNFVIWGFDSVGDIEVVRVENNDEADKCGSLAATLRDARRAARRENKTENSALRRAMVDEEVVR
jgi:hypothetical protein